MTRGPSRRRFLSIAAAACVTSGAAFASQPPTARWRGVALGAAASIRLTGVSPEAARPIFAAVEAELNRLEDIFSLYRRTSSLTRLNETGILDHPPGELLEVLSLSGALHAGSEGAFDPTIQPVFDAHARAAMAGRAPSSEELAMARDLVGWRTVRFGTNAVRVEKPGARLTLNGIAQGYITDRIAALLKAFALSDILVDVGEIVALGNRPDGSPWRVGVAAVDGTTIRRLSLSDRAVATSSPVGTVLERSGHIFDPATAREASGADLISVSAPTAAVADGLSTALCVVPRERRANLLRRFPGARLEVG